MYSSQEWWSNTASGGGGGSTDPGAPITGSLRFRGAMVLTRAWRSGGLNGTNWCASLWVKATNPYDGEGPVFVIGDAASENWIININTGLPSYRASAGAGFQPWNSVKYTRDTNAWYHFYVEGNTSNEINLWINGELQPNTVTMTGMDRSLNFGGETNTNTGNNHEGYMADIYVIQGQQLGWNTFARVNADGVIVPVAPTITGDWGPNGVHLEFKNPNEIGEDSSPNNDGFTPKGFDEDPNSPNFDLVADSPTNNYAGGIKIHKGNNQIYTSFANMRFGPTGSDLPGMLTNFIPTSGKFYGEFTMSSFDRSVAEAGIFMVPKTYTSAEYMWNVGYGVVWKTTGNTTAVYSEKGTDQTTNGYSNDLTGTSVLQVAIDYETGELSIGYDNKWLVGASTTSGGTWGSTFGVTATLPQEDIRTFMVGAQGYGAYNMDINWGQYAYTYSPPAGFGPMSTENFGSDIINGREHFQAITGPGQGADSGTPGQLAGNFSDNVTASAGFDNAQGPEKLFDGVTGTSAGSNFCQTSGVNDILTFEPSGGITVNSSIEVNFFGNTTPRDYVITVDGADTSITCTPSSGSDTAKWWTVFSGSGNFTKMTCQGWYGGTMLGIKVDGELLVDGNILAIAQQTFPNGLWWIKDRTSTDQHQLVSTTVGDSQALTCPSPQAPVAYSAPSGDSVAWCWGAPESWTSPGNITDGYRNPTSGFSMFKYPGSGSAKSVPHGLTRRPGWFIIKRIDAGNSQSYACYHQGLALDEAFPNTEYMISLNQSNGRSQSNSWWNATAPDISNINLGDSAWVNASGGEYVCFAWEEIPGYSSYGVYKGNGDADGPYIDCGFKPAYLLIKSLAGSTSWIVRDTGRSVDNPTLPYLYPSATSVEASGRDVDFLSSGFKIRTSGSVQNGSANYHMYVAFAENPFNAPTNAR